MLPPLPWSLHIGSFAVPAHVLFESAAYLIGFGLYRRSRQREGDVLADGARSSIVVAAIVGAALGSKLLFWFEDPALTARTWQSVTYLMSGKTIVGALLGGTLAVEWTKSLIGVAQRTGDLFTLPLMVAMMIGRIGCYSAGIGDHTYGVATTLPWGVDFGDGMARHPVQLYEIVFLAIAAWMIERWKSWLPDGGKFRAFLIFYCAWRLTIDFWKPGVSIGGLTAIQWACATALVWYLRNAPQWFGSRRHHVHG